MLVSLGAFAQSVAPGRAQQDIRRDNDVDVKDFGARCDGVTDDSAAIQRAFDAPDGNQRLTISGRCVISRMTYIPANRTGMILETAGTAAGLIAKPGVTAFQMLRIYAAQVNIRNLSLNCNRTAANGLVIVMAQNSLLENVSSSYCVGDDNQINPFATPVTTTTSPLHAGSRPGSSVTVAAVSLQGMTLGGGNCNEVVLEHGTPKEELFEFTQSGNTLTQTFPATSKYEHSAGATIQCTGNNDGTTLNNLQGLYSSGGWGLNIFGGPDNNNITVRDPLMFSNALGGELWAGSVNHHIGGHSEGNTGPALQLGDLNGGAIGTNGRSTFAAVIEPFLDLENTQPAYNAVTSVCDGYSLVWFKSPSEFLVNGAGGPFCPALPAGVTTLGTGYDRNGHGYPRFTVKSIAGSTVIDPGMGISFYDAAGTQKKLVLSPTENSTFIGVRATGLAGAPNRPACLDAAGNVYAGTNADGVLTCP